MMGDRYRLTLIYFLHCLYINTAETYSATDTPINSSNNQENIGFENDNDSKWKNEDENLYTNKYFNGDDQDDKVISINGETYDVYNNYNDKLNDKDRPIDIQLCPQNNSKTMRSNDNNIVYYDITEKDTTDIENITILYLSGYDDEIFYLKKDIEEKGEGDDLLIYFYFYEDLQYHKIGNAYTNIESLQECLSKYSHYFCMDNQYLNSTQCLDSIGIKYKHSKSDGEKVNDIIVTKLNKINDSKDYLFDTKTYHPDFKNFNKSKDYSHDTKNYHPNLNYINNTRNFSLDIKTHYFDNKAPNAYQFTLSNEKDLIGKKIDINLYKIKAKERNPNIDSDKDNMKFNKNGVEKDRSLIYTNSEEKIPTSYNIENEINYKDKTSINLNKNMNTIPTGQIDSEKLALNIEPELTSPKLNENIPEYQQSKLSYKLADKTLPNIMDTYYVKGKQHDGKLYMDLPDADLNYKRDRKVDDNNLKINLTPYNNQTPFKKTEDVENFYEKIKDTINGNKDAKLDLGLDVHDSVNEPIYNLHSKIHVDSPSIHNINKKVPNIYTKISPISFIDLNKKQHDSKIHLTLENTPNSPNLAMLDKSQIIGFPENKNKTAAVTIPSTYSHPEYEAENSYTYPLEVKHACKENPDKITLDYVPLITENQNMPYLKELVEPGSPYLSTTLKEEQKHFLPDTHKSGISLIPDSKYNVNKFSFTNINPYLFNQEQPTAVDYNFTPLHKIYFKPKINLSAGAKDHVKPFHCEIDNLEQKGHKSKYFITPNNQLSNKVQNDNNLDNNYFSKNPLLHYQTITNNTNTYTDNTGDDSINYIPDPCTFKNIKILDLPEQKLRANYENPTLNISEINNLVPSSHVLENKNQGNKILYTMVPSDKRNINKGIINAESTEDKKNPLIKDNERNISHIKVNDNEHTEILHDCPLPRQFSGKNKVTSNIPIGFNMPTDFSSSKIISKQMFQKPLNPSIGLTGKPLFQYLVSLPKRYLLPESNGIHNSNIERNNVVLANIFQDRTLPDAFLNQNKVSSEIPIEFNIGPNFGYLKPISNQIFKKPLTPFATLDPNPYSQYLVAIPKMYPLPKSCVIDNLNITENKANPSEILENVTLPKDFLNEHKNIEFKIPNDLSCSKPKLNQIFEKLHFPFSDSIYKNHKPFVIPIPQPPTTFVSMKTIPQPVSPYTASILDPLTHSVTSIPKPVASYAFSIPKSATPAVSSISKHLHPYSISFAEPQSPYTPISKDLTPSVTSVPKPDTSFVPSISKLNTPCTVLQPASPCTDSKSSVPSIVIPHVPSISQLGPLYAASNPKLSVPSIETPYLSTIYEPVSPSTASIPQPSIPSIVTTNVPSISQTVSPCTASASTLLNPYIPLISNSVSPYIASIPMPLNPCVTAIPKPDTSYVLSKSKFNTPCTVLPYESPTLHVDLVSQPVPPCKDSNPKPRLSSIVNTHIPSISKSVPPCTASIPKLTVPLKVSPYVPSSSQSVSSFTASILKPSVSPTGTPCVPSISQPDFTCIASIPKPSEPSIVMPHILSFSQPVSPCTNSNPKISEPSIIAPYVPLNNQPVFQYTDSIPQPSVPSIVTLSVPSFSQAISSFKDSIPERLTLSTTAIPKSAASYSYSIPKTLASYASSNSKPLHSYISPFSKPSVSLVPSISESIYPYTTSIPKTKTSCLATISEPKTLISYVRAISDNPCSASILKQVKECEPAIAKPLNQYVTPILKSLTSYAVPIQNALISCAASNSKRLNPYVTSIPSLDIPHVPPTSKPISPCIASFPDVPVISTIASPIASISKPVFKNVTSISQPVSSYEFKISKALTPSAASISKPVATYAFSTPKSVAPFIHSISKPYFPYTGSSPDPCTRYVTSFAKPAAQLLDSTSEYNFTERPFIQNKKSSSPYSLLPGTKIFQRSYISSLPKLKSTLNDTNIKYQPVYDYYKSPDIKFRPIMNLKTGIRSEYMLPLNKHSYSSNKKSKYQYNNPSLYRPLKSRWNWFSVPVRKNFDPFEVDLVNNDTTPPESLTKPIQTLFKLRPNIVTPLTRSYLLHPLHGNKTPDQIKYYSFTLPRLAVSPTSSSSRTLANWYPYQPSQLKVQNFPKELNLCQYPAKNILNTTLIRSPIEFILPSSTPTNPKLEFGATGFPPAIFPLPISQYKTKALPHFNPLQNEEAASTIISSNNNILQNISPLQNQMLKPNIDVILKPITKSRVKGPFEFDIDSTNLKKLKRLKKTRSMNYQLCPNAFCNNLPTQANSDSITSPIFKPTNSKCYYSFEPVTKPTLVPKSQKNKYILSDLLKTPTHLTSKAYTPTFELLPKTPKFENNYSPKLPNNLLISAYAGNDGKIYPYESPESIKYPNENRFQPSIPSQNAQKYFDAPNNRYSQYNPAYSPNFSGHINLTPSMYNSFKTKIDPNLTTKLASKLVNNLDAYIDTYCINNTGKATNIPIGEISIAKYEPKNINKMHIKTDNPDIDLKTWPSKLKIIKARIVLDTEEKSAINFLPIVKNMKYYSPEYVEGIVKQFVSKYYGEPIMLKGVYSYKDPFAIFSDINEYTRENIYLIWPTLCDCGCLKSGCQCYLKN